MIRLTGSSAWFRCGLVTVVCVLATIVGWVFGAPGICFLLAVMVSALYAGQRFSLAALIYGRLASDYLFLPPKFHFAINRDEYGRITIYLIAAIVVRYLIQAKHKSDATREALTGRYKLLVDTSPIAIIFLDAQYKITNANPAAAETFGFGEDGLKGLSLHLLLPELQYERSTKQAISGVRRDGSRFYAEVAHGESKLDGESVSTPSVPDVTEQTLAREALAASQLSLSLVLEMLPGFVWRGDPMGSFEMVSREALDYLGHVVNGPADRTQFMHPDDLETRNRQIEKMVQTGIPQDGYYRMRDQTGKYRWFHARMNPLRDNDGKVIRWCGLMRDIEEQKRAEDELRANARE
jgi:PAS domain S-box-containing protein